MADKDFTTTELISNVQIDIPNAEQIKHALADIAEMAEAVRALSDEIIQGDESGYLNVAVGHLASKIGWTADRCRGFDNSSPDEWLMSPEWRGKADKA